MLVILATQEAEIRRIVVRTSPGQTVYKALSRKNRTGGVTQAVQHLSSKYEAPSSNPGTVKKKKNLTSSKAQ
jgi:hypothetical protein